MTESRARRLLKVMASDTVHELRERVSVLKVVGTVLVLLAGTWVFLVLDSMLARVLGALLVAGLTWTGYRWLVSMMSAFAVLIDVVRREPTPRRGDPSPDSVGPGPRLVGDGP